MTVWLIALLLVGFGYLAVALVFAMRQERLFFKPRRPLSVMPGAAGLAHEDVALTASDGVRLHGWWLPGPPEPTPDLVGQPFTILYLHGASTNIGGRLDALRFWHGLGCDVLAVDYRGYGDSEGRPSEAGLYRDARAAWEWLVRERGVRASRIVVAAESMGVSVATHLGRDVRPAGMVLEAGFTRATDVASRRYPWLPVRQLLRIELAAEDHIGRVRCPILLVHSVDDRTVPITLGRRLERRAAPPRRLLKVRGAHAQACTDAGPRYHEGVRAWLGQLDVCDGVA